MKRTRTQTRGMTLRYQAHGPSACGRHGVVRQACQISVAGKLVMAQNTGVKFSVCLCVCVCLQRHLSIKTCSICLFIFQEKYHGVGSSA